MYINGDFACGLSSDIIIKHDLHEGDEISQDQLQDILFTEEKAKIKSRAFRLLHYRDRSSQEMKQRLMAIGFDEKLVREVIDEFIADTTLDNQRFVKAFIHDYTIVKPKGNVFIQKELRKKGIPPALIQQELATRDEYKLIRDFIVHKCVSLDHHNIRDRQKMIRRLLGHGFSSHLVFDVINKLGQNNAG